MGEFFDGLTRAVVSDEPIEQVRIMKKLDKTVLISQQNSEDVRTLQDMVHRLTAQIWDAGRRHSTDRLH